MSAKCPKCHHENPEDTLFCGKCGTQFPGSGKIEVTETIETPREELTRGATFASRYEIIEELGKGGMGRVYRVEDTKLKQEVALKLIKPEIAKDKRTIERFRNELKTARMIAHKNVCRMFDLGEAEGAHFITMEYVRGEDLKSMIRMSGQLGIGTAINIASQVCEGLAEAHRLGVVHRDLKPSNIMIDKQGHVRIMDFGIARSLEAKGITGAGMMIGTPEYMSPEQVEGKEIDQRSDIYSLGIILYEMLTGSVPFEGDSPFTIGVKHKSEKPEDPVKLNSHIPDDLSHVILKCLEKVKDNRCQSAGEVRSELENIEKGIPTTEKVITKRKPLTSREITVTLGIKKILIPAAAILALAAISILIWQLLSKKEAIPISPDKPTLAVMYFKNNTGDESLDNLRSALSDLLITDLSQSRHIRVLTADRIFEILEQLNIQDTKSYSSDDLIKVAAKGGATHIVQGSFIKLGETFRIDIDLKEAGTMESFGTEKTEGKGEESIFTMVDDLTRRIKANFKLSEETIAGDIDKKVDEITTSSPEAYKYYVEGRKYHSQGDFHKSIELMEKAVAVDPEFAMAYRSMAASHWSLYNTAKSIEYYKRAFELADRLPEREKYLIQGNHYRNSEKTWDKAIDAYNKLLGLYPEDGTGLTSLGFLYDDMEDFDKAIDLLEKCIQLKVEFLSPYANLANGYRKKGLFDKSRRVLEGYLKDINDTAVVRWHLAQHFLFQGKFELALAEAERSLSLDPSLFRNFWTKGDTYLYQGDFNRAEREYQKLLEQEEKSGQLIGLGRLADLYLLLGRFEKSEVLLQNLVEPAETTDDRLRVRGGHSSLSYLYLKSGRPEKAMEECEKVWALAVEADHPGGQRDALYMKSQVYLAMGSPEKARRTAAELKEIIDEGMNKKLMRMHYHLMGLIEIEIGQYSQAIDFFKKSLLLIFTTSSWQMILADSIGTAYFKAGNLEKAQEEYEKVISPIPGRIGYGDIYAKAFYMLGLIYEQHGDTAKAIENYEKFLDLWKDADPGLPEVEDAKKRLAGLS